jgi:hypothetical protein
MEIDSHPSNSNDLRSTANSTANQGSWSNLTSEVSPSSINPAYKKISLALSKKVAAPTNSSAASVRFGRHSSNIEKYNTELTARQTEAIKDRAAAEKVYFTAASEQWSKLALEKQSFSQQLKLKRPEPLFTNIPKQFFQSNQAAYTYYAHSHQFWARQPRSKLLDNGSLTNFLSLNEKLYITYKSQGIQLRKQEYQQNRSKTPNYVPTTPFAVRLEDQCILTVASMHQFAPFSKGGFALDNHAYWPDLRCSVQLCLFQDGFSLGSDEKNFQFYSKDNTEFLAQIDKGIIPTQLGSIINTAKWGSWYDGQLIVEIKDYRNIILNTKENPLNNSTGESILNYFSVPAVYRALLRPSSDSLWADCSSIEPVALTIQTQLEASILLATKHNLCFDPSPRVMQIANFLNYNKQKFNLAGRIRAEQGDSNIRNTLAEWEMRHLQNIEAAGETEDTSNYFDNEISIIVNNYLAQISNNNKEILEMRLKLHKLKPKLAKFAQKQLDMLLESAELASKAGEESKLEEFEPEPLIIEEKSVEISNNLKVSSALDSNRLLDYASYVHNTFNEQFHLSRGLAMNISASIAPEFALPPTAVVSLRWHRPNEPLHPHMLLPASLSANQANRRKLEENALQSAAAVTAIMKDNSVSIHTSAQIVTPGERATAPLLPKTNDWISHKYISKVKSNYPTPNATTLVQTELITHPKPAQWGDKLTQSAALVTYSGQHDAILRFSRAEQKDPNKNENYIDGLLPNEDYSSNLIQFPLGSQAQAKQFVKAYHRIKMNENENNTAFVKNEVRSWLHPIAQHKQIVQRQDELLWQRITAIKPNIDSEMFHEDGTVSIPNLDSILAEAANPPNNASSHITVGGKHLPNTNPNTSVPNSPLLPYNSNAPPSAGRVSGKHPSKGLKPTHLSSSRMLPGGAAGANLGNGATNMHPIQINSNMRRLAQSGPHNPSLAPNSMNQMNINPMNRLLSGPQQQQLINDYAAESNKRQKLFNNPATANYPAQQQPPITIYGGGNNANNNNNPTSPPYNLNHRY